MSPLKADAVHGGVYMTTSPVTLTVCLHARPRKPSSLPRLSPVLLLGLGRDFSGRTAKHIYVRSSASHAVDLVLLSVLLLVDVLLVLAPRPFGVAPTTATPKESFMAPSIQPSASSSRGQRRSGYEPSDTESEWNDSPWHDADGHGGATAKSTAPPRSKSTPPDAARQTITHPRSQSLVVGSNGTTSLLRSSRKPSPLPRRLSRLPPEPAAEQEEAGGGGDGKNLARHDKQKLQRHVSPYRAMLREEPRLVRGSSSRSQSQRMAPSEITDLMVRGNGVGEHFGQVSRVSESTISSYKSHRSMSAPKPRIQPPVLHSQQQQPPLVNAAGRQGHQKNNPSASEIEEITNADIFFSQHYQEAQKNPVRDDSGHGAGACSAPSLASDRNGNAKIEQQRCNRNGAFNPAAHVVSANSVISTTSTKRSGSHFAVSRNSSIGFSKDSDRASGIGNGSFRKFTTNRQKAHIDSLFSCVKSGTCRRSKSPDARAAQEASYIEKAFVVEELRQFWADKHRPRSLSGFTCHRQQAQQLQKLISFNNFPHIILKGPPGSGKRTLALALLHEIFGDPSEKISHELRRFLVQENRSMVSVPFTSSPHHVELDIKSRTKSARYALMGLVKQMVNTHGITPEVSDPNFKPEYKVIVLYANNKVAENIQHLMKWVMDCHTDVCKIILCCEDEEHIIESVRGRCKVINLDAPETHEVSLILIPHHVVDILLHIAKKESFELSMGFATKIATKSRQNLRKAIMALESCKAYRHPFVDEQPIPIGWEEALAEIAFEVLADPSTKRLFYIRGQLQQVLVESVHPKLILQKLVEEFIKGVQASFRRELYYWLAYYVS
ncbi:hypothetical protein Taro_054506 [Colocasia esculenta]|uniref:Replication factor C subunit 3 n=1 Tax=Colocasia esculenta TaxID=4460 RepID=A0A843XQ86_COLES|nr:hypothetical protein [Colocasia esculenta]